MDKFLETYLVAFVSTLFISRKVIKSIYSFILISALVQYIHFNYYGTWIFPLEYLLFFTKFRETMQTFTTVLEITVAPIIIITLSAVLIFKLIDMMDKRRVGVPYLTVVLIFFLIFIPARVFIDDHSKKGARPNMEVSPFINTVETLGYFLGRVVPQKLSNSSGLEQSVTDMSPILRDRPDINIVVMMGESLTTKPMSLYGANDATTPHLDKLKNDKNFLYQIAFASGVMTDISLPSFFNITYQPDSTPQIISTNSCLFKMAKLNGFETHFYSAQCRDGLSNVKSYMCTKWIDNYSDGTDTSGDIKIDAQDDVLLKQLNAIDLSKANFIVLHQVGSHTPFKLRYPEEFDIFEHHDGDRFDLSEYKNSILYTDHIISQVVQILQQKSKKPTYLFFTSDHGEGIDEHSGHGHLEDQNQYEVPFIMYEINTDNTLEYELRNQTYTSHFEIAKLIAKSLGYDTSNLREYNGEHIVCGRDITGVAGYLKIKVEDDNITALKVVD